MYHGGPPGGHHPPPDLSHAPPGGHAPQGSVNQSSHAPDVASLIRGAIVKIFSAADPKFNLGVRGDEVVVVTANDSDFSQQWIKDESWSNKAKDSAGKPAFALVNRASGKALTHPHKEEDKVFVSTYHQNSLNEEVLWSSAEASKGYYAIRSVSNIKLNLDIDHGSKKYGGIKDGKAVILFTWKDEDNQHWKFTPLSTSSNTVSATSEHHHHFH